MTYLPDMDPDQRAALEARFWPKVDKPEDEGDCWMWVGCVSARKYGSFRVGGRDGKTCIAHRVAYELLMGPIPRGTVLDHLCREKLCVNPAHLEPVSQHENIKRAHFKRVIKVRDEDVEEIRARYSAGGITQTELAEEYGVSSRCVSYYVNGQIRNTPRTALWDDAEPLIGVR
jgi:hypothetical protein